MAGRRCPICQTDSEPKVVDGKELCPNCELQLPPADMRPPAPPPPAHPAKPIVLEPDAPRTSKSPRRDADEPPPRDREQDRDRYERPRRREQESSGGGSVGVAVAILLAAFVLLTFFIGGVVLIKGKPAPTTKPFGPMRGELDPWNRPPPPPPWEK